LRALGVRNLVLGIHDPAFPGVPGDDAGRGSPYSQGGQRFFEFAAALGFSGVPGIPSKLWHGTSHFIQASGTAHAHRLRAAPSTRTVPARNIVAAGALVSPFFA
jgi:hypothetical protein